jgi:hypothetical protein
MGKASGMPLPDHTAILTALWGCGCFMKSPLGKNSTSDSCTTTLAGGQNGSERPSAVRIPGLQSGFTTS